VSEAESAPVVRRFPWWRRVTFIVLLLLAGLLLLLSAFAVWIDRVALNTDQFSKDANELIADPAIRSAVAQRAVDELYANVDVEAAIEERLPTDVQQLAGPTAAALRQVAPTAVARALEQPALQKLWTEAVEQSHAVLVRVLEGDGDVVSTQGGEVVLDLRSIVLEAADRLGIKDQVESRLPADAGRIVILRSDELDTAQNVFQLLKTLAWLLPILTILAFAGAVALRPDRRALRGVGITIFVVGVLGLIAEHLTRNYIVDALVEDRTGRHAANNAWDILTDLMRASFWLMVVVGILFVVAFWLAGPGRHAINARKLLSPILRERVWAYVALAIVALVLVFTSGVTDFARFLVIALLVGLGVVWIEFTRRQTMHEFPDASGAVLLGDTRTRVGEWWDSRRAGDTGADKPAAADVTAQLANLAQMHARGELTDEEYASAKARVLGP
jgi:hypothetical protein